MAHALQGKAVDVRAKWEDTKKNGRVRKCHAVLLIDGDPLTVMAKQERALLKILQTPGIAEAYAAMIAEADSMDRLFNGDKAHRPANRADAPADAPAVKAATLADLKREAEALAKPKPKPTRKPTRISSNAISAPQNPPRA